MAKFFDTHCHAAPESIPAAIPSRCVLMATSESDWDHVRATAAAAGAQCGLGIHPWHAHEAQPGWIGRLENALQESKAAVVGEIGLDRARRPVHFEEQRRVFKDQLALASRLGLPVSVHAVKCSAVLEEILLEAAANNTCPPAVALHSVTFAPEFIQKLMHGRVSPRLYFGVSANHTLRSAKTDLLSLPLSNILLETDLHVPSDDQAAALDAANSAVAKAHGVTAATAANAVERNAMAWVNGRPPAE